MKKLLTLALAVALAGFLAVWLRDLEIAVPTGEAQGVPGGGSFVTVEFGGLTLGTFKSVEGLKLEVDVLEFVDATDPTVVRKRPGRVKYGDITLKKGVVASNYELFDWMADVVKGQFARKNMSIILHDSAGGETARYELFECFPKSWTGPSQVSDRAGLAIEKIEVAVEKVERARG